MKRILFTLTLLLSGVMAVHATPVDLVLARTAAAKFAEAKFSLERQNPELVYTGPEDSFFVFNFGDKGFVIIAADDAYRPVIGYSDASTFDADNIPPALIDYLDGIASSISRLRRNGGANATPMVAAEWHSLLTKGELLSRNGGRGVDYLVQTQWNQDYPYNYYCPEDPDGPHGHTYVGCLATSMAQLVSFWKNPEHGYGSHCYIHEDYGEICADYQNTYYDWDHIANRINANSPIEEIQAVALISFHCGVAIDMGYGPDGSGGGSAGIPAAMHQYYNYSEANVQYRRNDFETEVWKTMVREQFDMGWPMYYGGCDDGCHAFICDGYDDKDMFHFNLGWGGGSDGWYLIDEAPYTHPADAMFNFVPSEIYDITPSAPANFTAAVPSNTELRTELQWTNPTASLDGTPLASIEELVVMRDNKIIHTIENVTPGASLNFVDEEVPYFDKFHYAVYAKANGRYGKHADAYVTVGPTCDWKVLMSAQTYQGWKGGCITVYNSAGHEVANCTLASGTQSMQWLTLPLGKLYFTWSAPEETVQNMSIVIRDSENNLVFSFTGSSDELTQGVFFESNNGCGNAMTCGTPQNAVASDNGDDPILLTWDAVGGNIYGYNVYRDDVLCRLVQSGTSYLDEQSTMGGHCYQVAVLCEGGESELSNLTCATDGPCYPPRNLTYEFKPNNKVRLRWEAPEETEGLTVYYLFRKKANEEYRRIKLVSPTALTVDDNSALEEGQDYYYQLKANYMGLDCFSAPANVINEPNVFELHVHVFPLGVEENLSTVAIVPNPTKGTVTITGKDMQEVTLFNVVGQKVDSRNADGETVTFDLSERPAGLYFVHVLDCHGGCSVRKLLKQ